MDRLDTHPCDLPIDKLLEECRIQFTRRSGPGGQHRNKVESAVVITHLPTQIVGQASERRNQHTNRKVAIHRLRVNLAVAVRSERPTRQPPSERWRSRLAGRQLVVNPLHEDFAALLAEALDAILTYDFELPKAADELGCSTSQLTKLIKLEPTAKSSLNQNRAERGLPKIL